jgi:hypothetical protein
MNARLGRSLYDEADMTFKAGEVGRVTNIAMNKLDTCGLEHRNVQFGAAALEVVESDYPLAIAGKFPAEGGTNESGAASYEYGRSLAQKL